MTSEIGQIPMSPGLGATLAHASDIAAGAGASEVTLEHVLAALCEDPDAIAILDSSSVDAERLKVQLQAAQIAAPDSNRGGSHSALMISQDVRRILEASAAAARGSRRREINGAIVLAAIVGDGRSRAAELLQSSGLTFDSAVRALQSTMAQPNQIERPQVADDVLARARERVQSRAAPSLRDIIKDMPRPVPPPPIAGPPPTSMPVTMPPSTPPSSHSGTASAGTGHVPAPATPAERPAPPPTANAPLEPPAATPAGTPDARGIDPSSSGAEARPQVGRSEWPAGAGRWPSDARGEAGEGGQGSSAGSSAPMPYGPSVPTLQPASSSHPAAPTPPDMLPPFNTPLGSNRVAAEPSLPTPAARDVNIGDLPELTRPQPGPVLPPPIPVPVVLSPGARLAPAPGPMPPAPSHPYPSAEAPRIPGPLMPPPSRSSSTRAAHQADPKERKRKKRQPKGDTGLLVETIPRAMRVGRTERVEIRIAKAAVKGLTDGMEGGPVNQHEVALTRAMSVRVRAPEGGFFIESASPETQWIENALGFASDEYASWRFLVTPHQRGWARLQIVVSARTVGPDGAAAESALPDQVIEVKVRANLKRTFARTLGWVLAAVIGGALSTFGQSAYQMAQTLLARLPH